MPLSPQQVYEQHNDCQRILIIGPGRDLVSNIIVAVLKFNNRKFSSITDGEGEWNTEAPIAIFRDKQIANLPHYRHHIILLTGPLENVEASSYEMLLNATPKSGIVLYPESDAGLKSIGSKERADVQAIPYKTIPHEEKNGRVTLVTSTNEKFPIQLTGEQTLELLGAAKEMLKKIGISSGQFYRGVASIKA
jgi:UDP-N-acetylmuramate: L-alanyl-gamma-D-glutamyl-meso-diaminopimelate ligase